MKVGCRKCGKAVRYIVDEGWEDYIYFCKKHYDEYLINVQYPNRIKALENQIEDAQRELTCQTYTGHDYKDITHEVLSFNKIFKCKNCGHICSIPLGFGDLF